MKKKEKEKMSKKITTEIRGDGCEAPVKLDDAVFEMKRDKKSKHETCYAFPTETLNPGIVNYLKCVLCNTPGACLKITTKCNTGGYIVGKLVKLDAGVVYLDNAFDSVTTQMALQTQIQIDSGLAACVGPAGFAASPMVVNIGDISTVSLLNGDLCNFFNTLGTTSTDVVTTCPATVAALLLSNNLNRDTTADITALIKTLLP